MSTSAGRGVARHRAQAPDWRGRGLGLGPRREKAGRTRGECARQAPGCLSCLGLGRKERGRSFLFRTFVELPRAGTARSTRHAPYRAAGSLSSAEGKAALAPPRRARELATRIRVHLRPPVSGRKLGTEETGKQAK